MSEPWEQRIEEICDRANRLAQAERAAFLKEVCGDDAVLRGQVQMRLDQDRRDLQQTASRHLAEGPDGRPSPPVRRPNASVATGSSAASAPVGWAWSTKRSRNSLAGPSPSR